MSATADNGWELSITRFIPVAPEIVWDVMSNRLDEWWCPKPWRAEFDRLERRPGGASSCTMYGPDGEVHPNPGTVLAWDEGRRFAFTDAIVGDLMPAGPFMIGIWSVAADVVDGVAGTRYTATCRHWTEADCQRHAEMGFEEGWGACADQLVALAQA